eukprot:CAMPEP_0194207934 /NCGR_PEP_ID=MMETSP0156-20130528/6547_1 /TAXON_ID=33649 /ORGANISM="Thalassionema nitzschioides, Strain L26-B" /LENGTH=571 /DNA_ID=CAMNT_0038934811 /DNA_START=48 /DNA_END=1760 /DNA_ORIENTATION=-
MTMELDDPQNEEVVPLSSSNKLSPLEIENNNNTKQDELKVEAYQLDQKQTPNHDTFLSPYLPVPVLNFLYPPIVPRSIQLLRAENIAIPACYLCVGILQGLSGPFINVYPLFLGATEAQQTTIMSIRSLPASFKIVFGFLSDNVPFLGYRRKAYMFLGWALSSLSMAALYYGSNLERAAINVVEQEAVGATISQGEEQSLSQSYEPPEDAPSIQFLTLSLLLFGTGFWFADVMGDSLVAEKAKLEPPSSRGQLQSTCYACRFFGLMVCSPISTVLYHHYGAACIVRLMMWTPLVVMLVPLAYLYELAYAPIQSTRDQCQEIWTTVCSRAVWQPMGFVYLYNVLQIPNAAWKEFLKTALHFDDWQLNTLLVIANVLVYVGVMAYKYYFIKFSWRCIYIGSTILNAILSLGQVILITGHIPFGLSPFVFALGDDIFADFIAGVQFLPTTIMMVHLCPSGSEGASYAMFTTVSNCAGGLASALSTVLTRLWDVSKESIQEGHYSGMLKLSILTTILQTSGLLFVKLLPKTKEDLHDLSQEKSSKWGGALFLAITFFSVLYAIVVNLLNVLVPGW